MSEMSQEESSVARSGSTDLVLNVVRSLWKVFP